MAVRTRLRRGAGAPPRPRTPAGRESSVTSGMSLGSGASLKTSPDASLSLQFADGSRLQLLGDSELLLDRLTRFGRSGMVDTRLRLRGGGPKRAIRRASLQATEKATQMRDKLQAFEKTKKSLSLELQQAHTEMTDAPGTSADAKRQLYLQKLHTQRSDYETALQDLKQLNVFDPFPDYRPRAMAYLNAQLDLSEAGISEAQRTFTPVFRKVLDQIEQQARAPQERHIEGARQLTDMNQDMIERLDYVQSRFEHLRQLPSEGLRQIQERKKRLPLYTSDDLRALQVTLSRNLCLTEASLVDAPEAWAALDKIVNTADIAVQAVAAAHVPPVAPVASPESAAETNNTPLTLHLSRQLEPHAAATALLGDAQTSADTLTLTPENWLHSKEP